MELFVKICLKMKKDIFESLLKLFVKKDVSYHFPRRTIHYENPLLSGKVNRQHTGNILYPITFQTNIRVSELGV